MFASNAATIVDPKKLSGAELWAAEITAAEAELKKFHERGRKVNKQFLDERDAVYTDSKWFNIFYANTNILESALYAQLPKPAVSRRFTDYNDEVGRVAALIIERSITQDLDDPTDLFDATMRHAVQDRLVPGLAAAWLRLETETEPISLAPTPGQAEAYAADEEELPPQKITSQKVCVDYIYWQDFLWSPCRVWEERRWVGRKAYMTREELKKRFGEDKGGRCPLDYSTNSLNTGVQSTVPKEDVLKKAVIYEIWDRTTRKVIWYAKGMQELMDEKDDPLGLKGFEPCPRPMLANCSTSNTTPRPDYYMIQDQYSELDTVNNRISMLVQACKVVGVYDKAASGIQRMLKEGSDNLLIPVDNWAMFAEKGGIKGTVDWLPLETVVQALQRLNEAREVIKGQIYELTGIADIVRGASKASETLGAQQIKAQFASIRIKKLQDEVARFASDIMRIKAEIMVKHFDPNILIQKSNIMVTGNEEWVGPAIQLLQSEEGFEWKIQVNSDTMSQADYSMEKQDRIDFMTAISGFMQQVGPMLEAAPESAPVMLGLLKWTVAGFRGARDIEGMLDKALDALQKQPEKEEKPDPATIKAQAEQQKMEAELQMKQQEAQMEMQQKQAEMQMEQQRFAMEQQKFQAELQFQQAKQQMEMEAAQAKMAFEAQMSQVKLQFEQAMNTLKLESEVKLSEVKLETAHEQAEIKREAKADAGAASTSTSE